MIFITHALPKLLQVDEIVRIAGCNEPATFTAGRDQGRLEHRTSAN